MANRKERMEALLELAAPAESPEEARRRAERAQEVLDAHAAGLDWSRIQTEVEDLFVVEKMLRRRLWLRAMSDDREFGPIDVPEEAGGLLSPGWRLVAVLGKAGRDWRLLEVSEVQPV